MFIERKMYIPSRINPKLGKVDERNFFSKDNSLYEVELQRYKKLTEQMENLRENFNEFENKRMQRFKENNAVKDFIKTMYDIKTNRGSVAANNWFTGRFPELFHDHRQDITKEEIYKLYSEIYNEELDAD